MAYRILLAQMECYKRKHLDKRVFKVPQKKNFLEVRVMQEEGEKPKEIKSLKDINYFEKLYKKEQLMLIKDQIRIGVNTYGETILK